MTLHYDLLDHMRQEWRSTGRSARARTAADEFIRRHDELQLGNLEDLYALVVLLEAHSVLSVERRAAVVRAMLEEGHDPLIHRALLQTLIPGIVSVCRQLRFGSGIVRDPSETLATALGLASELLTDWSGQSRQYAAPDLLSALRGRLRRWLLKEKAALGFVSLYEAPDIAATASSPLALRLDSYRGGEHERLARLTYARVFEGRSLRELARNDHSAPSSLQAELRHFAVRFLI
ncbi:MAG TPA: hypothetical protein VMV53_10120 [Acidimicrobiales bacterium]|nr:hypothetical protein [Acidimicrobiales bacterium]